jgi:DNA-binding FadR family transcriptional regulator
MQSHRLAESVADRLRARIFSGEISEGAMLPKQDALCREFNVGLVTVREALRMLEVEGLVTVKRGNLGGSVVHRPETWRIAYMIALSLQSRSVDLADVLATLRLLEPLSAAACAQRPDRAETVVPKLKAVVDQQRAAVDDGDRFIGLAVQFHVVMAQVCGIATLSLVLSALENIWSAQLDRLARHTSKHGSFGDRDVRLSALADHERMLDLIVAGDAAGAERAARDHMSESHHRPTNWSHEFDLGIEVDASYLRQ